MAPSFSVALPAAPVLFVGHSLLLAVHPQAARQEIEVHLMAVEFRSIDTGEFRLPPDGDPAGPAHPRGIHHDGVEADDGLDTVGPGEVGDDLHHGHGPDGEDPVDRLPGINETL